MRPQRPSITEFPGWNTRAGIAWEQHWHLLSIPICQQLKGGGRAYQVLGEHNDRLRARQLVGSGETAARTIRRVSRSVYATADDEVGNPQRIEMSGGWGRRRISSQLALRASGANRQSGRH